MIKSMPPTAEEQIGLIAANRRVTKQPGWIKARVSIIQRITASVSAQNNHAQRHDANMH